MARGGSKQGTPEPAKPASVATQVEGPSVEPEKGTAELETNIQPQHPPDSADASTDDGSPSGADDEPPPDDLDGSHRARFRQLLFELLAPILGEPLARALVGGHELDFALVNDELEGALKRLGRAVPPAAGRLSIRIKRGLPHKRHVSAGGLAFSREWRGVERSALTASALQSLHDDPLLEVEHLD